MNDNELFSLKDHLLSIISKLDRLEGKLDTKADLSQAQALDVRVSNLERYAAEGNVRAEFLMPKFKDLTVDVEELDKEIVALKQQAIGHSEMSSYRKWLFGVSLVGVLNGVGLFLQATLR